MLALQQDLSKVARDSVRKGCDEKGIVIRAHLPCNVGEHTVTLGITRGGEMQILRNHCPLGMLRQMGPICEQKWRQLQEQFVQDVLSPALFNDSDLKACRKYPRLFRRLGDYVLCCVP